MNNIEERIKRVQSEQDKRYTMGKILATLDRIIELDTSVPIAQHWASIMRSKGEVSPSGKIQQPYYWDNDRLLGAVEQHYKEFRKRVEDRFDNLDGDIDSDFLNERILKNPHIYGK